MSTGAWPQLIIYFLIYKIHTGSIKQKKIVARISISSSCSSPELSFHTPTSFMMMPRCSQIAQTQIDFHHLLFQAMSSWVEHTRLLPGNLSYISFSLSSSPPTGCVGWLSPSFLLSRFGIHPLPAATSCEATTLLPQVHPLDCHRLPPCPWPHVPSNHSPNFRDTIQSTTIIFPCP